MKARLLKQILNNTGYTIADYPEYIAIGSYLCHNLINIPKQKPYKLKYESLFETKAKPDFQHTELEFIWDTLQKLIDTGQINDIIEGNDTIITPLPVFYYKNGKVVETVTDSFKLPNTTIEGESMYSNTHFKTFNEAREYGLLEEMADIALLNKRLKELKAETDKFVSRLDVCGKNIEYLRTLK